MKKGEAINDVGRSWLDNRRLADIYRMRESNRDVAKIVDKSLPRRTLQLVYGSAKWKWAATVSLIVHKFFF